MNIIHVTSWLSRRGGGIPPVIWALARESSQRGQNVSVVGLRDEWIDTDCKKDNVSFVSGEIAGPQSFGFSPDLRKQLQVLVQAPGIVHSHGLWMYPGWAARKTAVEKNCRLLVSPHGMLEPWALARSSWKKKVAGHLFEYKNLERADCLHALCLPEAENFRRCGLKNPIAIIPNGVDIEEPAESNEAIFERFPQIKSRRLILFLSRLHPKKGLGNLLQAWKKLSLDFKDWQLLIAGGGDPAYENELKALSIDLVSKSSVVFMGQVQGDVKKQILAAADAFVLPSFSEGFSMAILEAAAAGLPVLLTPQCNFPELARANAAIEIPTDAIGIEKGLRQILELPDDQRKAMGLRGCELIKKSYTWPAISEQMCRVYDWMAGAAERPETTKII
jgi:glycosyltransferase involved in cell wall biosynthesis